MAEDNDPNVKKFTIDSVGDITGIQRTGTFGFKLALSFKENFIKDEHKRLLLGNMANGVDPSPDVLAQATQFAELRVRLVEAPDWWKESENGVLLKDENILDEVYYNMAIRVSQFLKTKEAAKEASRKRLEELLKSDKI